MYGLEECRIIGAPHLRNIETAHHGGAFDTSGAHSGRVPRARCGMLRKGVPERRLNLSWAWEMSSKDLGILGFVLGASDRCSPNAVWNSPRCGKSHEESTKESLWGSWMGVPGSPLELS